MASSGVKVKDPGTACSHCPATDTISFMPRPRPWRTCHCPQGQPASCPWAGEGEGAWSHRGVEGLPFGQGRITQGGPPQNREVLGHQPRATGWQGASSVSPWPEGGDRHG